MPDDNTRILLDTYSRGARWYDAFVAAVTLGMQARLRTRLVNELDPRPGDVVLDLACGTGLNFPALERAVGPAGRIIGVDLSADMLTKAGSRVARSGWNNVAVCAACMM